MLFKDYLNRFYLEYINPDKDQWREGISLSKRLAWIWLSVFYTATRSDEWILCTELSPSVDFIKMRTKDSKIELEISTECWVVLASKSNWKKEIVDDLNTLIQLTYRMR